jgi:integrase
MAREILVNLSSNGQYWQADWRDSTGRRRKKSLGPKSQVSERQARKLSQQLANALSSKPGLADAGKVPTLGSYLDCYLQSRAELKPSSRYLLDLTARYLKRFFGDQCGIDQISRAQAREWQAAIARGDFSVGRAMAEVSVCHRCADAKGMFQRAVDDDLLAFNPFDRLKVRAPKPDKNWHYVSLPELDRLMDACPTPGWKALVALCRLAGLRRGEALSLPWTGVDWQKARITVFAQKTERHGGNKRVLPLDPKLLPILKAAQVASRPGQLFVCDVNCHCLWRNFTVIRKHAGLPAWKDAFQVMRRNCETDWAQRFPQYAVSEWLGHDITVSAAHYLIVTEELYQKAAAVWYEDKPEKSAPKSAPNSEHPP